MKRITIIGGGASGTLLAVNLLRQAAGTPVAINLVEKRERVGVGVAYSTGNSSHLLNVPAAKMGAFPNDVEHFYSWLKTKGYDFEPASFVPRKIYGEYLRDLLDDAIRNKPANVQINVYDAEAVDVEVDSDADARVVLNSDEVLPSDIVVLAFGNFLPPHPTVEDQSFTSTEKYFQNPWNANVYDTISPDDSVLIVGTGLSMVDFVMHFHDAGHRGKITAISTRGLLPATHRLGYTYPSFYDEIRSHRRITDLLKSVRKHIRRADTDSSDWRAVIDSLRPHTQELWLNLPTAEKKYFMQHLSRYWNVARHRMPAEAAEVLDKMTAAGKLEILKGRLRRIGYGGGKFEVVYGSNDIESTINADAIINCIGSESNFERVDAELVRNLMSAGHIRTDPISQGLDALPDGRIVDKNGVGSDVFHTLGTALKGILLESTAMPEIRAQAKALAGRLLAD